MAYSLWGYKYLVTKPPPPPPPVRGDGEGESLPGGGHTVLGLGGHL